MTDDDISFQDHFSKVIDGASFWVAKAPTVIPGTDTAQDGLLALPIGDLQEFKARREYAKVAQFYMLVLLSTQLTKHIFRGLRRPLFTDDNPDAAKDMLVYTRSPPFDFEWIGGARGKPVRREAPKREVFSVIVRPNDGRHNGRFPSISGWINAWTWLDEDDQLPEAPLNWVERYDDRVWTRSE